MMTFLSRVVAQRAVAHWLRKLRNTVQILSCLLAARMLGKYETTVWNGEFGYARYRWRGRSWPIPTTHIEEDA